MAVPDFQTLMKPVLELLAERGQLQFRQLLEAVCDRLQLSDEDMAEAVPSGQTRIDNRVGWTVSYLVQAGAVARPRRGYAEITDRQRTETAAQSPARCSPS